MRASSPKLSPLCDGRARRINKSVLTDGACNREAVEDCYRPAPQRTFAES